VPLWTATLIGLAVAIALSFVAPRRFRMPLAAAVLIVPLAYSLPSTIRHERAQARAQERLTSYERAFAPPIHWRDFTPNVRLLAGLREHVPPDATIQFRPGGTLFFESGWLRWEAFVLAPRRITTSEGVDTPWIVLIGESPAKAGMPATRIWRYGNDWLVLS
jgi:hypothetical protein